ncbi:hypothetical protein DVA67_001570 [Solirubrobacter sp. CPCC 204708]|uniref:Uncharacterized protein n=1 Tax=Solirubrobacter deserti TaxID=2282478 RepID=A0ABT4RDP1_9ACTN|nr:hypothetical protein [Solirubrobacter deserti]MBE2314646.1 hypothetical protein [Solirubrobacter deserti]MDA0136654.1 hypothetical protein [Solirubrobacter deserti]
MCYAENEGAASQLRTDCASVEGAITVSFDCGRDDYFSPAPAPGSYLATHWNTYDSVFMAPCATIAPACSGGAGAGEDPVTVPSPTTDPAIIGAVRRGATLKTTKGAWINRPTRFTYRWQRLTGSTWRAIPRADRRRYRPTDRDVGRRLRVVVAATNEDGTTATTSEPTARVSSRRHPQ